MNPPAAGDGRGQAPGRLRGLRGEDPDGGNRVCLESFSGHVTSLRADDRSVFFVLGSDLVRIDRR